MTSLPNPQSPEVDTHTSPLDEKDEKLDAKRRRLGIGVGSGLIMTLASRPVLAGCMSPSAAASGNMSQQGPMPTCAGCQNLAMWLAQPMALNIDFHNIFVSGPFGNWDVPIPNTTFKTIMEDASNAVPSTQLRPNPLSAQVCVTYLNIQFGCVPPTVLTDSDLSSLWAEFAASGQFSPSAGVSWDANEIVTYLLTLQS